MSAAGVADAVARLDAAQVRKLPCPPVRDLIGATDVNAAYAVQRQLVDARVRAGASVVGRKIGLTSEAVQQQLGVDQPDFGVLFDDMDLTGRDIPTGRLLQPKIEAELAFVLGADLTDPDLGLAEARAAVAVTRAALEIVDSRIQNWDISYADTVADNASSGLYVLGDVLDPGIVPSTVDMSMTQNGAVVSTGNGRACLGNPLLALVWLARTAVELGDPLRAGQVVLSGALGPMVAVAPGDIVRAELSVLGSTVATVATTFETEEA